MFVTSAKEVMFLLWFTCLFVFFVSRITLKVIDGFYPIFWSGWLQDWEQLIRVCEQSGSGSGSRNFLKDPFSLCQGCYVFASAHLFVCVFVCSLAG